VLYTHQKVKKSKTWQDGILRIRTGGNKAILFDDKGQCLESIFIKSQVNAGDNLESERYLITVESLKGNEKSFEDQPRKAETPAVDRNGEEPGVLPPRRPPVGLKRKFIGFQGPRQVEKKISAMEDGEKTTILPLSRHHQDTFQSKFYITSPLFSTICKKETETNLSAEFYKDVCTDDEREHMSLSSLLSAPFLDRCEETETRNPDQSLVKPDSPLIPGSAQSSNQAAGHTAVSHNIRSTAQIIALLNSKRTQGCSEQTMSEVTECPRYQASSTDSFDNQKSTTLPALSGNPAKRLIQHLPFMKGTVSDRKDWNAGMLLNLAEQPCNNEVTGQRDDKKADNLSQELHDPCNTNSCFLPESTISIMSDSQFVASSGDIPRSASPVTFERNLPTYREHSGTNGLKENSSVKLQSDLQPRQNSQGVPSDLGLSLGVPLTESGIVEEELNCLKGEDVAQNAALSLRSCCELVTHGKTKVKCSTFDGENDGNHCTGGLPSQLCDISVRETGRIAEDSADQTRIEVELLGDGRNIKEINESRLSIEATNNKKDFNGCALHTVNGVSWIKSKHSDLLPGDTDVNECDPKTSMFEKTESTSCISTSRIIPAMDKRTEDDVIQLGCRKAPGGVLEHFWGTKSDDIKPESPLLALSQKSHPSYGSFQYRKGHSTPEKTAIGETAFENRESINAFHEACKGERIGTDCLKCTATAKNSSDLPDWVNNITLIRALTQHSTALESLQKMEENNSILYE
ncbi:Uncharacterized protein C4orf21, partial [Tyto alba]